LPLGGPTATLDHPPNSITEGRASSVSPFFSQKLLYARFLKEHLPPVSGRVPMAPASLPKQIVRGCTKCLVRWIVRFFLGWMERTWCQVLVLLPPLRRGLSRGRGPPGLNRCFLVVSPLSFRFPAAVPSNLFFWTPCDRRPAPLPFPGYDLMIWL